jgi:hypothetical protein
METRSLLNYKYNQYGLEDRSNGDQQRNAKKLMTIEKHKQHIDDNRQTIYQARFIKQQNGNQN